HWGELPGGRVELGESIKRGREKEIQGHRKALDDMHKSLASSYAFLGKDELHKLQAQMTGLSSLRQSLSAMDSLKAAMGSAGLFGDAVRNTLADARSATDKLHD